MRSIENYFLIIFISLLVCSCGKDDIPIIEEDLIAIPVGTVDSKQVIKSSILGIDMHYSVYLPPGYESSDEKFPVLYLLHGMYGDYTDWVKNGMAAIVNSSIASEEAKKMIVIMPDGLDAFYCNNFGGGSMLYEDFMIQEFFPQLEEKYRINATKKGRAIAGLSMGGYGAAFHAFKRPELFCCCYSMSGALDMGNSAPDIKEIINSKSEDELNGLPVFTMECGTEDYLVFSANETFDAYLTEKGIEHSYVKRSGVHDWVFWKTCLPKTLKFVSSQFE